MSAHSKNRTVEEIARRWWSQARPPGDNVLGALRELQQLMRDEFGREAEQIAARSYAAGFDAGREQGRIAGVREGVELAKDHAWVCDHNGWHPISPCIEWEGVEKAIADLPIARSSKEDS